MDDIAKMQAVKDMMESDGWEVLSTFIQERIEANKEQLMHCKLEDVQKHRTEVETYGSVFSYLQKVIDDGEEELKQLPS